MCATSPPPDARREFARRAQIMATSDLLGVALQNGGFQASQRCEAACLDGLSGEIVGPKRSEILAFRRRWTRFSTRPPTRPGVKPDQAVHCDGARRVGFLKLRRRSPYRPRMPPTDPGTLAAGIALAPSEPTPDKTPTPRGRTGRRAPAEFGDSQVANHHRLHADDTPRTFERRSTSIVACARRSL